MAVLAVITRDLQGNSCILKQSVSDHDPSGVITVGLDMMGTVTRADSVRVPGKGDIDTHMPINVGYRFNCLDS